MKKRLIMILLLIGIISSLSAAIKPFVETEQGLIAVLFHTYQNGTSGTDFDFRSQGGQDVLYPFERYTVGVEIADVHRIWLTYQPLRLDTSVAFRDNVTIGTQTFATNTPMNLTYSFPFYRISYTYDILAKYPQAVLGVGVVMQIRNASIVFEQVDGAKQYVSQNVGFVPALAVYARYEFPFGLVLSADIAGSYAKSAWFNGAGFEFEGSVLDASLRMGYLVQNDLELFGNLRFFGGTAEGTSTDPASTWTEPTDRFTKNNIATLAVSVGVNKAW